ncbi:MAG: hypothetical protein JWM68_4374 [Verrucomicrobiales bacterium]|nr:hypothetical protein [Verrucomicrobiales bacterium]
MKITRLAALTVLLCSATFAFAQKETLGVDEFKASPSLVESIKKSGKTLELGRVKESLDSQLIDRINATRKFQLVARSDLKNVVKEQELANSGNFDANDKSVAKQFQLAGAKYILVTSIDDFDSLNEQQTFDGTGKTMSRRTVRLSVVGKIYEASSSKLLDSANFQLSTNDVREIVKGRAKDGNEFDELFVAMSRDAAEKIANRVADVVFPVRVLSKRDKQIMINRGEGAGVSIDQVWNVFALGEELIDPDTKESLGREEVLVGKAKIVAVNPKMSTAEILEDTGIDKGAVLRLPQVKK